MISLKAGRLPHKKRIAVDHGNELSFDRTLDRRTKIAPL